MKKIILLTLATTGLFSCQQGSKSTLAAVDKATLSAVEQVQSDPDIYSSYVYTDVAGKRIIIQNGYPRGGVKYTDSKGHVGGYVVFWSRISNETDQPLEMKMDVAADSYELSNFPDKFFKVLLPADTITADKIPLLHHAQITSFLDHHINQPSSFSRTIGPKESSGFYFVMLIMTEEATGMTRAELSLKGQDLFYKISRYATTKPISLIEEKEIRCGSINLTNLRQRQY